MARVQSTHAPEIVKVGGICERCSEPTTKRGPALLTEGGWAVQHHHALCPRCHVQSPILTDLDPDYNIHKLYAEQGVVRAVQLREGVDDPSDQGDADGTDPLVRQPTSSTSPTSPAAPEWDPPKLLEHLAQVLPAECECPITHEPMHDPVVAADGHTYERHAITRWLESKASPKSPKTGAVMDNKALVPNHAMKSMIQEAVEAFRKTEKERESELRAASGTKGATKHPRDDEPSAPIIKPSKRRQRV